MNKKPHISIVILFVMVMTITSCKNHHEYSRQELLKEKEDALEFLKKEYPDKTFTVCVHNDKAGTGGIYYYRIITYATDQNGMVYYLLHDKDWDVEEYTWLCHDCRNNFNIGYKNCPYCGYTNTWYDYDVPWEYDESEQQDDSQ